MKIALCLFKYFPYGGLQKDFMAIALECLQRNHHIEAFCYEWRDEPAPFPVHVLNVRARQNHTRNRTFIQMLKNHLQKNHFDVVIGFNKMPGLDVYYAADVCFAQQLKNKSFLQRLLPRYRHYQQLEADVFARNKKTQILLISSEQKKLFTKFYNTEDFRMHLLPPGIRKMHHLENERPSLKIKIRNQFAVAAKDTMILFVGSGFKTKGLDRALLAIKNLAQSSQSKLHFFIIGDDKAAPYKKFANKANAKIHYLGGRNDVYDFMCASDVLLHPARHENTGTVLLEALTAGLPVLCTDVCGYAPYVIKANAGMVLPSPFTQHELNSALGKMIESKDKYNWQQNALNFAKDADIYDMKIHCVDLIEKIAHHA